MPQPAQNSLIHVLLLWTTLLSIVQVVFMILFFTAGHHDLSHNTTTPERPMLAKAHDASSLSPSNNKFHLVQGQMLAYKLTEVNGEIKWEARDPSNSLISEKGKDLQIMEDGYYFLVLQVTLKALSYQCNRETELKCSCGCNEGKESECSVSLKRNDEVLLEGWINSNTCSTGLLGKVEALSRGTTLEFHMNMPSNEINESESLTHLDIIMLKPQRML